MYYRQNFAVPYGVNFCKTLQGLLEKSGQLATPTATPTATPPLQHPQHHTLQHPLQHILQHPLQHILPEIIVKLACPTEGCPIYTRVSEDVHTYTETLIRRYDGHWMRLSNLQT